MTKRATKKAGSEADSMDGLTQRRLMSIVNDVAELANYAERVHIQVAALAADQGIRMPEPEEVGP